jgi:hypothetical protein
LGICEGQIHLDKGQKGIENLAVEVVDKVDHEEKA